MLDFQFLHDVQEKMWIVLAPRRQTRPNIAKNTEPAICPFCVGQEGQEEELYRIGGQPDDTNWQVRVLSNKYPFAPHHEVIIHSPDHHKNLDELPVENVVLFLQACKARFQSLEKEGQVFIFHNHGIEGGESLPHPHTQLVVIPKEVAPTIPVLPQDETTYDASDFFRIFCPTVSQWPDEVWIVPKEQGKTFAGNTDEELANLALVLQRVLQLLDMRHGHEFPFNFYISPEKEWYVRIIPRIKRLGGFELGTNIFVNTQDPKETFAFIQEHFASPDVEKIEREQKAEYAIGV